MYAAVYLHKHEKLGIDIENFNRKFSSVEKKYLSEKELEQVKTHSVLRAIYWCCKEAVFKWTDVEGIDFRTQIHVENFDPEKTNTFCAVFKKQTEQRCESEIPHL